MGFKQEATQKLAELDERVGALEEIANRLGYGRTLRLSAPSMAGRAAQDNAVRATAAAHTVSAERTTADVAGLDYAAIAFGLSEVKRKVAAALDSSSASHMASEYAGTVDYFADVFAKSDPSFNRDEFNRLAQR